MNDNPYDVVGIFTAFAGAFGSYANKLNNGHKFAVVQMISMVFVSGFSGVMINLLCHHYGLDEYVTAALTGVSGLLGYDVMRPLFTSFFQALRKNLPDKA